MRALAIAALIALAPAGAALALPVPPLQAPGAIVQVQLQCTPASCIDPRTGVYTESTCDYRGCRPSSGPVGRLGGQQRGYGGGYDGYDERPRRRRDWDDDGYRGGGYGGGYGGGSRFDCNASRCVETGSGRVWESTCDRRGCRPLRPARGY